MVTGVQTCALPIFVVTVVVLGLLAAALHQLAAQGQLAYPKWRYFLGQSVVRYLGAALGSTLLVTVVSAALSFPLGSSPTSTARPSRSPSARR